MVIFAFASSLSAQGQRREPINSHSCWLRGGIWKNSSVLRAFISHKELFFEKHFPPTLPPLNQESTEAPAKPSQGKAKHNF